MGRDIREVIEPELGNLRQDHAFAGRAVAEHDVEGAHPVGGDDQKASGAIRQFGVVDVAHLAAALVRQPQVRLHDQRWQIASP